MTFSGKKKKTRTEEEFERQQAGTSEQFGVQRQVQTIDPTARQGLDFLVNQATGLADAPLAPGISPERREAIAAVGSGGGISPEALATIKGFAAGEGFQAGEFVEGTGFETAGRGTLDRLIGNVGRRAASRVSDLFSLGGRGGSPASAEAVARGVSEATSPFEFGFEREELARGDRERARQEGRLDEFNAAELQRQDTFRVQQLGAAFGLAQVESAEDAAELQRQIAALEATGQIDAAEREKLEEPFRRLGLIADVVTPAVSLLPKTTDVTSAQRKEEETRLAGTSAGRSSGTEFGISIPLI